ncbi:MAG: type III pantothenate kinase [Bacteroidota bacterium]
MRNLVIDIGNTRVKYGCFANGILLSTSSAESVIPTDIFRLLTNHQLENIIYSSVAAGLDADLLEQLSANFRLIELTATTALPIHNAYDTPATLGKDRLAAVVGAQELYPATHCLVVDAGTCMTLDVLRADATYLGGNISPGIQMRLQAMHQQTFRLPLVATEKAPATNWGTTTVTALQNGGILGAVLEIEALAQRLRSNWPDLKIVLTGGDANLLAKRIEYEIFVHSNLVLSGLNKILAYNVQ